MFLSDIIYCTSCSRPIDAPQQKSINNICAYLESADMALPEYLVIEHLFFWSTCIPTLQEK